MNEYLVAVILGLVEGLTEFLPVSSTAHLRLCQALLGINLADPYWTMFSIVIQVGAILCLPLYFRRTIWEYLTHFPKGPRGNCSWLTHPLTLVMVAFVFTAIPTLLQTKLIGENLESIPAMASALVIGGVIMWVVDAYCSPARQHPRTQRLDAMGLFQSIWIGLCQALSAIFPGTSRSMATISGGQLAGMSRSVALEFSFLLSIPTMVAATGFDLLRFLAAGQEASGLGATHLDLRGTLLLAIGGLVSFAVAYLSVAWFMHWVRHHGFIPFAIYRILAGTLLLIFGARLPG
ncbi:MAG: undecaprenyl-diphosphate phosphatase [Acidobacteria bacterium]|nr:undecaprenyl-diphosphate phosphatase [Acidobacteriota bacterium]